MRQAATRLLAVLAFVSVIAFWRGVWYLQDVYLAPGHATLSPWLSVIAGYALLLALGATRSLLAPPFLVELDGSRRPPLWRIPTFLAARAAQASDDTARAAAFAGSDDGATYIGERHVRNGGAAAREGTFSPPSDGSCAAGPERRDAPPAEEGSATACSDSTAMHVSSC